jgi:hypothetical protein
MSSIRIKSDGPHVVIIDEASGHYWKMPWNQADEFAAQIKLAAKVEQITFDQAVVLRAGFPAGFTDDPRVHDAARKEAGWNARLRRLFHKTPDVRRGVVGTPQLVGLSSVGKPEQE